MDWLGGKTRRDGIAAYGRTARDVTIWETELVWVVNRGNGDPTGCDCLGDGTRIESGVLQPPSWDSPPKLSSLKTKKKLLPYLEAADLETSSQAASYQEEHLLATPEEEIDPELIEFVKRDQFHDLFSESLEAADLETSSQAASYQEENLLTTPEEEIDPELIEFVKRDQFHDLFSEYALEHTDHFDNLSGEREREEEEWGGIPPHPEVLNEELIKHVERNPFYNSTSKCAKEHLCNFEQLCHDYGLGDNPKKIQLFQLSLAGQAKEWAKFNAQHAFKTWNGYKGAFLYRFAKGPIYVPPPRPSYSQHHPSSPDINKTPLFPRESYQAARQTKIEDMLQEYLRNQDESTKKMERRIDFIHESLGNKSEVLFKQVIKLDEDIKNLREDHDRSLTLVKLDVASKQGRPIAKARKARALGAK
ncbi:unnamed protein product [Microthlaspi erraticum]|uniref:Retrotransposon gag domain-containing protein n=1 Tax=Microthlaspi erraticum TaxID=1685480 RepID=A0A6D2IKB4_9BRAS|nr:unnamed protein product [Microthlaspi erraticum]